MIISDEQVRHVLECLQTQGEYPSVPCDRDAHCTSPELMTSVVRVIELMPDVRSERVAAGRRLVEGELPDAEDVASKLIGRVLSDSLR